MYITKVRRRMKRMRYGTKFLDKHDNVHVDQVTKIYTITRGTTRRWCNMNE